MRSAPVEIGKPEIEIAEGAGHRDRPRIDTGEGIALGAGYAERNGIRLGDEVRVRFPALPPPPPGHARTWLVHLDGYAKDGDANTTASATVEPLPFHAMSTYPPGDGERSRWLDDDPSYPAEWNTRPGRRLLPSLVVPPR